jgi:tRNA modification GTPase
MPSFDVDDTIVAIASAHGSGLRGILRISGPQSLDCLQKAFRFSAAFDPAAFDPAKLRGISSAIKVSAELPLVSSHQDFSDPRDLSLPGVLLIWPTRSSYTRQPAAEFHTFASANLLSLGVKTICQAGARLAQPGEFTLRAFLSGRLDLPQAEAVLAVIDSRSSNQLDGALKQMAGGLSNPLSLVRQHLLFILAELEAGLDFVEEDIEFISNEQLLDNLQQTHTLLEEICVKIKSREWSASLIQAGLIGLPNAGKSSLFNALLGAERAIVSGVAGTTTDFLSGMLELNGIAVELIDTAGMETEEERKGEPVIASLAQQQREKVEATVRFHVLCLDASKARNDWELDQLQRFAGQLNAHSIVVLTHADLATSQAEIDDSPSPPATRWLTSLEQQRRLIRTSIKDPASIQRLRNLIEEKILEMIEVEMEVVGSTMIRTAESLRAALAYVAAARQAVLSKAGEEIVAAEIRGALEELGLVVGTIYTDDILDVIFSRFCIGK